MNNKTMEKKRRWVRLTENQAMQIIPKGCYCYDERGTCPFWDSIEGMPDQANGYCHWLQSGDWEDDGTFLLWEMCKECGLNDDEESLYSDKGEVSHD